MMDWIDLTLEEWRDKCIAANARADCYEEQMKDLAVVLENLEKRYKHLSEMHQTEVRENRELWEEIQRLKKEAP